MAAATTPVSSTIPTLSEDIFERAAALKQAGLPFVLATVVWSARPTSARPGAKGIITEDGALFGWVGGSCAQPAVVREAALALADGEARLLRLDPAGEPAEARPGVVVAPLTCHSGGTIEIFLEPYLPPLQLVVVGESPVADALVRLGRVMGYRVVAARLKAEHAAPSEADLVLDHLELGDVVAGRRTVAVVASMGVYDEEGVAAALRAGAGYVALVASGRRFAAMRDVLADLGLPAGWQGRLKAPAGIDISAGAPEEIAVSILAEIIARRRQIAPAPALSAATVQRPATGQAAMAGVAIDPVCGMEVEIATARASYAYEGRTYYFCCPGCRSTFKSGPAAYLGAEAGARLAHPTHG